MKTTQKNNTENLNSLNSKDFSCGAYLKHIRQQKGISLETVSAKTKIIISILTSIEEDDYHNLPPRSFLKGMIYNYALFLKLDSRHVLDLYETSNGRALSSGKNDALPENRFVIKYPVILRVLKNASIYLVKISIFAVIIGYLIYEFLFFVLPPRIILISPQQDISLNESTTIIKGRIVRGKMLFWGTTPIPLDSGGHFQMNLNLVPGLNKIRLRAVNNIGEESFITRNIIYNPSPSQPE